MAMIKVNIKAFKSLKEAVTATKEQVDYEERKFTFKRERYAEFNTGEIIYLFTVYETLIN